MKKKDINYYLSLPYSIVMKKDPSGWYFVYVDELSGCMSQGKTYEEAYKNIIEAMEAWLESAIEDRVEIPEPEEIHYSGKFVVRIPKTLHKKLAQNAKKENVSLNQFVMYLLAEQNIAHEFKKDLEINIEKPQEKSYKPRKKFIHKY